MSTEWDTQFNKTSGVERLSLIASLSEIKYKTIL
jgi:hypothetical protein